MYFNNIKTHRFPKWTLHFTAKLNLQNSSPKNLIITMQFIYIHVLWIFERPLNYHWVHHEIRASGDDLQTFTLEFSFFFFFKFAKVNFFAKLLTLTYGNTCNNDFILITIKPPICYKKKMKNRKCIQTKMFFTIFCFIFSFWK